MRFELTVALKYLIPKWWQLSVSIISLISVLVISLVVWLVLIFLSVTEGMEKKWTEELVALNAPVRLTPTEAYYSSYYYMIDTLSADSSYTSKSIGEKLASPVSNPYDPSFDIELPDIFPSPDLSKDGSLKDLVKEAYSAVQSLPSKGIHPREFEINFGNLRLQIVREMPWTDEVKQTFLTQVSYVASFDESNQKLSSMILPPSPEDINNLIYALTQSAEDSSVEFRDSIHTLFSHLILQEVQTVGANFELLPSLFPEKGEFKGLGIVRFGQIHKVVIPQSENELLNLQTKFQAHIGANGITQDAKVIPVRVSFKDGTFSLWHDGSASSSQLTKLFLSEKIPFQAEIIQSSLDAATKPTDIQLKLIGKIQNQQIKGISDYNNLEISSFQEKYPYHNSLWTSPCSKGVSRIDESPIPCDQLIGDGILVAKSFRNNGVLLGDRGYIAYFSQSGSGMQEQRIPIYVAGFYDPGMMPIGNKLLFVDPKITGFLRGNLTVSDQMLGNGINIWLDNLSDAEKIKEGLRNELKSRGLEPYWKVESFHDYEFTRPILDQLHSDKNLFTLVAFIILIVACSNIISMLILLVNDKKKEIGILQSMGASPRRIAAIFGLCGFTTGLISSILGTFAAILTLANLQSLVDALSFMQGREAFQAAFYGSRLPNELSYSALGFVLIATLFISLLAGIVPAIKASKIRPTEILKSE